jgi:hypothetical protein
MAGSAEHSCIGEETGESQLFGPEIIKEAEQ